MSTPLVTSFPPEVLEQIFLGVQPTIPGYTPFDHSPPDNGLRYNVGQNWIWVTHVCRVWRRIALGTSSLWCNILVGRNPSKVDPQASLIRASLLRSGDRALVVRVVARHHACLDEPVLHEIFREAHRIKALYVYCRLYFDELAAFPNAGSLPLSALVLQDGHVTQSLLSTFSAAGKLDPLAGLKCLSAVGWAPELLQRFRHIRQLHLHHLPPPTTGPHDFQTFMATLEANVLLEDLVFTYVDRHSLMKRVFSPIDNIRRVQMPALRRLCLYNCSFRFARIFCSAFEHPPELALSVLNDYAQQSTKMHEAKACIRPWFTAASKLCFVMGAGVSDVVGLRESSAWRFDEWHLSPLTEVFQDIPEGSLYEIEELWLDSAFDIRRSAKYGAAKYRSMLAGLFRAAWNLKRLVISTLFVDIAWLDALTTKVDGATACPELATIVIYAPVAACYQGLSRLLASRAHAGHPLAHLEIYVERDRGMDRDADGGWRNPAVAELCSLVGECKIVEIDVQGGKRYPPLPLPLSAASRRCLGGNWDMPDWSWLCDPLR